MWSPSVLPTWQLDGFFRLNNLPQKDIVETQTNYMYGSDKYHYAH